MWFTLTCTRRAQLCHFYLHGSCVTHAAWAQVGHGLRLAQDMGAHRRRAYPTKPTIEGELMKRAFWYVRMPLG